ncbi:hypothetical protein Sru01_26770 [Sphaerisporangium rufum]|uniref:Uncharacterized protein n=1 Tax=Sphaerisporangium rufum TaxID=1381558 RepID=A0A919R3I4_9ACTN|nr:hypothetical protein Sru01_26770 [Sphaerisporangium rufum]
MKRILQLVMTRWLARTPIGMVILGIGWWFTRRRRGAAAGDRGKGSRRPGREGRGSYAGSSSRARR